MRNLNFTLHAGKQAPGLVQLGLEETVVVVRVVVRDDPPFDPRHMGECAGIADTAVPPTDLTGIFFIGVLRLVDEEVSVLDEIDDRQIWLHRFALPSEVVQRIKMPTEKLVVWKPGDLFPFHFDFIPEGRARMTRLHPGDAYALDGKRLIIQVVKLEVRAHVFHLDGEILAIQLPLKHVLEWLVEIARPVDLDFPTRRVGRTKKGETLNVIPVGVRDEEVQLPRWVLHQHSSQLPNPAACIEDKLHAIVTNGETRSVATVTDESTARRWRRSTGAPEDNLARRGFIHRGRVSIHEKGEEQKVRRIRAT